MRSSFNNTVRTRYLALVGNHHADVFQELHFMFEFSQSFPLEKIKGRIPTTKYSENFAPQSMLITMNQILFDGLRHRYDIEILLKCG